MWKVINDWIQRYLSDPEVIILFFTLAAGITILMTMGKMLAPVIASLVIAYLLQWVVLQLERCKLPHLFSVSLVFFAFLSLVLFALFGLIPLLWEQMRNLIQEFPHTLGRGQALLMMLPDRYPDYVSIVQMQHLIEQMRTNLAIFGQHLLSLTLASIPGFIELIVYLVLVPLLVFFFMKDRRPLLNWIRGYLPKHRRLVQQVWEEVKLQIGNYVRGKVIEIIIVSVVTYAAFAPVGLKYAMLLSVGVGLSVIIPYIGAVLITIPVIMIGMWQWGWDPKFIYLVIVYTIIIVLDANVLVPILFAEVVNLHPVAIILAVLIFGGIWGFWGVFFAIPLASLVKAVLNAWHHAQRSVVS